MLAEAAFRGVLLWINRFMTNRFVLGPGEGERVHQR
jgi:hypothetical protein